MTNGSPTSRYRHIPTQNLKFSKFIDLIHASKMTTEEIKTEICQYVQTIETNYNDTIRELKDNLDRERVKFKKLAFEKVGEITEKN